MAARNGIGSARSLACRARRGFTASLDRAEPPLRAEIASQGQPRTRSGASPHSTASRRRPPLPPLERELLGVGLVELERLLHLGGEALAVDLDVSLVQAEEA